MKTKAFAALAAVGIAATVASLAITPAFGASLPARSLSAGSSLFGIGCEDNLQLLAIDAATAAATPIGDGASDINSNCAGSSAWDAATSTAYFVNWGPDTALYTVNPATGVNTAVANFTIDGDDADVDAMAISPTGAAYAINDDDLYSLDLATGALTLIGDLGEDGYDIYGFAVNPTTGVFYTIDNDGVISTLDVATATLTELGEVDFADDTNPYSLQVDVNGTLWVENDGEDADIWSVDPADVANSPALSGTVKVDGDDYYTESLLLIPGYAPVITSAAPAASIVSGTAVSFTVTASGGQPITFAITSGALPTGLTLDPATGVISGTPTTAGTFTYTVTASNTGGSTTATYTQTITPYLPVVSG